MNQLKPEINRNEWTEEEDLIIWKMYKKMGSKWTEIAKKLT
jgi:myb-related protein